MVTKKANKEALTAAELKEIKKHLEELKEDATARLKDKTGTGSYLELLRFKLFQVYDINEAKKDMTGSAAELTPIGSVDGRTVGKPEQVTRALQERFFDVVYGNIEEYAEWVAEV